MLKPSQRKAMFAKVHGTISFDELEVIKKQLRKKGLLTQSMRVKDIVDSYNKNFKTNVKLQTHVNPHYREYVDPSSESNQQRNWDSKTQKQRYHELRRVATEDWALKHSKKSWSQLKKDGEVSFVQGAYQDTERINNAKRRDAHHHGYMIHTDLNGNNINHKFRGE